MVGIRVRSAGFTGNNTSVAEIHINGQLVPLVQKQNASSGDRGIHLVLHNQAVQYSGAFDTYLSAAESDELAELVSRSPVGTLVVVSVKDEASNQLTPKAKDVFRSLGSHIVDAIKYRSSWIFVVRKGSAPIAELFSPTGHHLEWVGDV